MKPVLKSVPRCPMRVSILLVALALGGVAAAEEPMADAAYAAEIEEWRSERIEGLKEPDSWLTLVGLSWLEEGMSRFGSAPESEVPVPASQGPAKIGTFERKGNEVTFRAAPGVAVTSDGEAVSERRLVSDADGGPTVLELGTLSFYLIRRGEMFGVRIKDSAHPKLTNFTGIDTYGTDPVWRVEARFEPYEPPKTVPIPTVLGTVNEQPAPGAVVFERDGETYRLDAFQGGDEGELFLIFADQTNGKETYGAGRFLYTEPPADGKVVVDFNLAYNPPCAFSPFATCPLPPPQNRLALAVRAGEKKWEGGEH